MGSEGDAAAPTAAPAAEAARSSGSDTTSDPGSSDQGGSQAQQQSAPAPSRGGRGSAEAQEGSQAAKDGAGSKAKAGDKDGGKAACAKPKLPRPGACRRCCGRVLLIRGKERAAATKWCLSSTPALPAQHVPARKHERVAVRPASLRPPLQRAFSRARAASRRTPSESCAAALLLSPLLPLLLAGVPTARSPEQPLQPTISPTHPH